MHPSLVDLTGKRFGKLMVIERAADVSTKSGKKLVAWKCRCACGKVCIVRSTNLKSGNTQSFGCIALKFRRTKCEHLTIMLRTLLGSISDCLRSLKRLSLTMIHKEINVASFGVSAIVDVCQSKSTWSS